MVLPTFVRVTVAVTFGAAPLVVAVDGITDDSGLLSGELVGGTGVGLPDALTDPGPVVPWVEEFDVHAMSEHANSPTARSAWPAERLVGRTAASFRRRVHS